jgi:PBP1b-binding outer membrane lipoprotein LpoB
MENKSRISLWLIIALLSLLVLTGCMSVTGSQNAIQPTSTSIFNNKKIAILPVKMQASLAPDSVMAMRTEVNKRLSPALQTKIPTAIITDVPATTDQLNLTNTLSNFEQLISSYEATGVMDKRQVSALGQALSCDFLLLSRLKSEKMDIGFISQGAGASLDVLLIDIQTGEISWAGSGEWKKGGIFGQGGASFSEFADNIVTPAFESLQSSGDTTPNTAKIIEKKGHHATGTKTKKEKVSRKIVAQAQQQLLALGYEPGVADGKIGKGTINAIVKFQKDNKLTETGQIDKGTISLLEQKTQGLSAPSTSLPQPQPGALEPTQTKIPPPEKPTPSVSTTTTTEQNNPPVQAVSPMDL